MSRATRQNLRAVGELERSLPVRENPALGQSLNFQESLGYPGHRWFRYREGFSPELLRTVPAVGPIYDPFAGCGTTLVEASARGLDGYGTDVNPLATFVATVKSRNYTKRDRADFWHYATAFAHSSSRRECATPNTALLPKLFQPEALRTLLRFRYQIDEVERKKVRDLLFLCWLNILEKSSNVYKEGNGIKYRNKLRRPHAYLTLRDDEWVPKYFGPSIKAFVKKAWLAQCDAVHADLAKHQMKGHAEILTHSCLEPNVSSLIPRCEASVFSPPYANRFDYFESFKVELWMGGFVSNAVDLQRLRKESMRNNLTAVRTQTVGCEQLELLLQAMDETASSVRMGIQDMLRAYFFDVRCLAENLKRIVAPGGPVTCVIGNSAYAGIVIPTDLIYAKVFEQAGFNIREVSIARHLTVSSQQRAAISERLRLAMRESVVLMNAPR